MFSLFIILILCIGVFSSEKTPSIFDGKGEKISIQDIPQNADSIKNVDIVLDQFHMVQENQHEKFFNVHEISKTLHFLDEKNEKYTNLINIIKDINISLDNRSMIIINFSKEVYEKFVNEVMGQYVDSFIRYISLVYKFMDIVFELKPSLNDWRYILQELFFKNKMTTYLSDSSITLISIPKDAIINNQKFPRDFGIVPCDKDDILFFNNFLYSFNCKEHKYTIMNVTNYN